MAVFSKQGKKEMKLDQVTEMLDQLRIPTALVTTPINLDTERKKFFSSDNYNPNFEYRIVKNENHKILSSLSSLENITDVDPRISSFYIKLIDSKKEANDLMNAVGDNVRFTKISINRFKAPTPVLYRNASRVLRGLVSKYDVVELKEDKKRYTYQEAKAIIESVFEEYGLDDWSVTTSMNIGKNGLKVGVKKKEILVDENLEVSMNRLKKNIVHELTHVLRAYNGLNSGFESLSKPTLPYYLDVEEGLATMNVEHAGLMQYADLKKRAGKVWAIYIGDQLTFRELYNASLAFLPPNSAFDLVYRVKRGLGDTAMPGINAKDVVYFRGFRKVRKKFAEDPKFIDNLYAGKIGFSQVKWVNEGLIKKPKLLPKQLDEKLFK